MQLNLPIAFSAGLVSFFAPCVVPLLPAYVAYVTGVSLQDLKVKGYGSYIKKILASSLFYILGFSLIFTLLGTAAGGAGTVLRHYGPLIQKLGGFIILVLGLEFAGILNLPFLARELKFKLPVWTGKSGYFRATFIGIVFALTWTPCIGAVLGSILALAASTETASSGALLLFIYSLGISIPFLIASLTLASLPKYLKIFTKHVGTLSRAAGILLAFLGLLLLTDTYKYVNAWIFDIFFKLGYKVR
ncbi:sulfite exporter TauE/SafE family protein [Candidatus Woesebacteria bacterium]|nr:sulfite exporter TauE/SafE family protein [Candidatus Woesebacteria bacterium]